MFKALHQLLISGTSPFWGFYSADPENCQYGWRDCLQTKGKRHGTVCQEPHCWDMLGSKSTTVVGSCWPHEPLNLGQLLYISIPILRLHVPARLLAIFPTRGWTRPFGCFGFLSLSCLQRNWHQKWGRVPITVGFSSSRWWLPGEVQKPNFALR